MSKYFFMKRRNNFGKKIDFLNLNMILGKPSCVYIEVDVKDKIQ